MMLQNKKVAPDLVLLHMGTMQESVPPFRELFSENRHDWLGKELTKSAKPRI
jgi:hypothetical protein